MIKKPLDFVFNAMHHGKYDFNDFARGDMAGSYHPKRFGDRLVYIPEKKLKAYHSFLNLFVLENLRVNHEVVFSYRKGVNVHDAVSRHAYSKHFFQTDLSNFFGSIDSSFVREIINRNLEFTPISDLEKYVDRIVDLVMVKNVLPMGFSTSPSISNACLFEFDNQLLEYCSANSLIYTRYSDDITVSGTDRAHVAEVNDVIRAKLKNLYGDKLSLNSSKSKFTHKGRKIKLLGMVILPNGIVTVDIKLKKQIEVLIFYYIKDSIKFLDLVKGDLNGGMTRLSGYLSYINTIDQKYLDKLRKKYGATIVDMFLHLPTK